MDDCQHFLEEELKDPEFRREYEALRPEFEATEARLREEIASEFLTRHSERFNEESMAAMREARAIAAGEIAAKRYRSVEELKKDLLADEGD